MKRSRGLGFQRKVGNSQVDKKEQTCGKQILAGLPRNNGSQKEAQQTGFARLLTFCHIEFIVRLKECDAPLLFLSEFL